MRMACWSLSYLNSKYVSFLFFSFLFLTLTLTPNSNICSVVVVAAVVVVVLPLMMIVCFVLKLEESKKARGERVEDGTAQRDRHLYEVKIPFFPFFFFFFFRILSLYSLLLFWFKFFLFAFPHFLGSYPVSGGFGMINFYLLDSFASGNSQTDGWKCQNSNAIIKD